jgi:hypothetical protein
MYVVSRRQPTNRQVDLMPDYREQKTDGPREALQDASNVDLNVGIYSGFEGMREALPNI